VSFLGVGRLVWKRAPVNAPTPTVPEEPRVALARQLRQRFPELRVNDALATWILERDRVRFRVLVRAIRLYGHHTMHCAAWGPGPVGRRCTCGLGDFLKEDV